MGNDNPDQAHDRSALSSLFENSLPVYQQTLQAALSILPRTLPTKVVVATTSRLKDFDSFYVKANRLINGKLKYQDPVNDIADIVGIRIIVIAQRNIEDVCSSLRNSLDVIEEEDKAAKLLEKGQLGYESYHLICRLGGARSELKEYNGICDQVFEVQVRTALQHAWAENEHRIQYKQSKNPELQKRFLRLAAAISSADEEFDRIYEIDRQLKDRAQAAAVEASNEEPDVDTDLSYDNDVKMKQISLLFGSKPSQLVNDGLYKEALQVYDRLIAHQPNQATNYTGRAKARALAGDIKGGLSDLSKAKELAPNHRATLALERFFTKMLRDGEQ